MHCEEFETRLNELLDERCDPEADAQLAQHASQCATCERLWRDYAALVGGVAHWSRGLAKSEPGAPDLVAPVMAQYETRIWRFDRRRAVAVLALAATLLLAALPALSWLRSVSEPGAAPAENFAAVDVAAPPALVDQARETYEPLLAAANGSLNEVLDALPVSNARDATSTAAPQRTRSVWDSELGATIEPVASSASRSLVALLRVVPGTSGAAGRDPGQGVHQ